MNKIRSIFFTLLIVFIGCSTFMSLFGAIGIETFLKSQNIPEAEQTPYVIFMQAYPILLILIVIFTIIHIKISNQKNKTLETRGNQT